MPPKRKKTKIDDTVASSAVDSGTGNQLRNCRIWKKMKKPTRETEKGVWTTNFLKPFLGLNTQLQPYRSICKQNKPHLKNNATTRRKHNGCT